MQLGPCIHGHLIGTDHIRDAYCHSVLDLVIDVLFSQPPLLHKPALSQNCLVSGFQLFSPLLFPLAYFPKSWLIPHGLFPHGSFPIYKMLDPYLIPHNPNPKPNSS